MKNAGARNLACSKAVCSNSIDKDRYQKIEASFKPWIIGGATNWRVFRHSCDESPTVTHVTRVSSRPQQLSRVTRRHVPVTRSYVDSVAVSQGWHNHKMEWKLTPFCAQWAACVHKRPSLFKRALTCCLSGVRSVFILMYVLLEAWSSRYMTCTCFTFPALTLKSSSSTWNTCTADTAINVYDPTRPVLICNQFGSGALSHYTLDLHF